ncbi:MAG: hypothetical protein J6B98_06255 [Bacilli bacterium]|nr:hypothetical protein [Bacilli bacterium]
MGGETTNNESGIVKAKIDSKLYDVLKIILAKRNMTQQEVIESSIKNFVIENINLVVDNKSDKK